MFCRDCDRREECKDICRELEEHLKGLECYQRELPFSPHVITQLSESRGEFFSGASEDLGWVWDMVGKVALALPPRIQAPFLLHYYHDMSLRKAGRTLGLHPTTVTRRIRLAHRIIRKELGISDEDERTDPAPRAELREAGEAFQETDRKSRGCILSIPLSCARKGTALPPRSTR